MIFGTLFRFLILALPLVTLTLGVFHFGIEAVDLVQPGGLSAPQLLGRWLLEATGLVALFVLVRERGLGRWLAGLASGWSAWIFRGPVLVLTVAGASRLSSSAWWQLTVAWFGLYTICGLVMASVARSLETDVGVSPDAGREARAEPDPAPGGEPAPQGDPVGQPARAQDVAPGPAPAPASPEPAGIGFREADDRDEPSGGAS